jgi:hypothetical protein
MASSCEHLERLSAEDFPPQKTPGACEECLTEGTVWVALRECQSCGHVWLLRFIDGKARDQTLPRDATSCHARGSACGLDVVLCP